jgi:hypothetical protein
MVFLDNVINDGNQMSPELLAKVCDPLDVLPLRFYEMH